jgi:uncharacterized membrane protein YkvA (DUF1232 family)
MFERIRSWARALRRDAYAVYLVARSPDTPWYVKVLAGVVAAYALSPTTSFRISFRFSAISMI